VNLGERLIGVAEQLANPLMAAIHRRVPAKPHQNRRVPLDVGVKVGQQRLGIPAVVSVNTPHECLDVHLRHGLLPQPEGFRQSVAK
jgi:hypothetical protein